MEVGCLNVVVTVLDQLPDDACGRILRYLKRPLPVRDCVMSIDLRHLAVILDAGQRAAEERGDTDLSEVLGRMTDTAVHLYLEAVDDGQAGAVVLAQEWERVRRRYT